MFRMMTIMLVASTAFAFTDDNIQCHKVVIAGDRQWPPYVIATEKDLKGVGIDLAKRIFNELDVPVHEVALDDPVTMLQGLRDGEIDLLVGTYNYSGLHQDVQLIEPAYIIDPITVAVPQDIKSNVRNWDSLHSMQGVSIIGFMPDDSTGEYLHRYMQIPQKDYLVAALQAVINGHQNYVVGSDLQLTYAIKNNNMQPYLIVMKNLAKGGEVHMAFSKRSPCKQYMVYVQKRLQDYKNNGTVEKILKKYVY